MASPWFKNKLKSKHRRSRIAPKDHRFFPILEPLGDRMLLSVTASFAAGAGVLSVFGDNLENRIVVSRSAAGSILINGSAVTIQGGASTVANTTLIQVFGLAGNDQISLDEANGALPSANLFGGAG